MAARDAALRRALLETELQLGPQGAALRGLRSERAAEYTRTRRVNASNERAIVESTRRARPEVRDAFTTALSTVLAQRQALGVGPESEQARAYDRRINEQLSGALLGLTDQATRAQQGRVYANQQARSGYLSDKRKIEGQLQDLAERSGLLTATRYGDIRDDQLERGIKRQGQRITAENNRRSTRQSERNSQRSAGIDPNTGQPIPGGKLDPNRPSNRPKGIKLASQEQHAAARDGIEEALTLVKQQYRRGTRSRAAIIRQLTTGRKATKVLVDGGEVTVPEIPKLSADYVRAATNLAFDKTLSRGDVARLHNRRLSIRRLGYPTRKR